MPLALLLALIGGYTDAVVFLAMHMWAGNMTGMLIFSVLALTEHQYVYALRHVAAVFVFTAGVIGGRLARHASRWPEAALALPVVLTAAAIPFFPGLTGFYLIAFAMGAQNAAVHKFGGVSINTVFMTGNLERLGEGVGDPDPSKGPGLIVAVVLAYASGVLLGGYAEVSIPFALVPTPVCLTAIPISARWMLSNRGA